jgi:lipopolysaccharide biosynthesis protein
MNDDGLGQTKTNRMAEVAQLIAIYLPQFHPIPENDEWWGKGFTEWTTVTRARALFRGHYQPHLPADLGFYDLRLPEVREAQASLAREYGIHGFCYYHYWFNGRRLLERPFQEVLSSGRPDFPFCLCWANENWTRAWNGGFTHVLIEQCYSEEDDRAHMRSLAPAFCDSRYIRVEGKPLFAVYRAGLIPNPKRTTDVWREEAARLGIGDLFLCRMESNFIGERTDPRELGFDAAIEFQPDIMELWTRRFPSDVTGLFTWGKTKAERLLCRQLGLQPGHSHYDYRWLPTIAAGKARVSYRRFRGVAPSWDNSARRKRDAMILRNATPAVYGSWLKKVVGELQNQPETDRLIFINAWNEWGEGNHLEPCQRWGRQFLEATRAAIASE